MIEVVGSLFWYVVTIGLLVTFHEFGHFWVARRCGVKVHRFSIGFGKPLWSRFGRDGTEYVLAAIPLGGYVSMLDERAEEVPPEQLDSALNRKPIWQKIAVAAAGPAANVLLALLVFWIMFMVGKPDYQPVLGTTTGMAAEAGLKSGMRVTAIDGEAVDAWSAVHDELTLLAKPRAELEAGKTVYRLGVGPGDRYDHIRIHGPLAAVPEAIREAWDVSTKSLQFLKDMALGALSTKHLSGPITIAQVANLSASEGLPWFLGFLGAVSLGLAILNLLPIPILDGGHILYYLIELIKGSPVSDRGLVAGQYVGLVMLAGLIGLAFFNDLSGFFR
ncbi:MAG: RIP metalloprotease RseP [Xanthomonadales bacterium]|nr:RIP metalloprotease RseP [Xanthomonadales bacterium]